MPGSGCTGPSWDACVWPAPSEHTRPPTHLFSWECRAATCRAASSSSLTSWLLLLFSFNLKGEKHERGAPRDPGSISLRQASQACTVMYTLTERQTDSLTHTHTNFREAFY